MLPPACCELTCTQHVVTGGHPTPCTDREHERQAPATSFDGRPAWIPYRIEERLRQTH